MELRHFRYAVAVAETLHFGRAAERLHISQPPLSHQIRQLEDELGVRLFHRTKRQVKLTEAGRAFVEEARVILARADRAAELAVRVSSGDLGRLRIGIAAPGDLQIFVEILRLFRERHPNVRMAVRNVNAALQAQALLQESLDIGFVYPPVLDPALASETIIRQPLAIALPRAHPLAARDRIPLRALASESHVMLARDVAPHFVDAVLGACRDAGFGLAVAHEVDGLDAGCALVAAGAGVCFVPAGIRERPSRSVLVKPLLPPLPKVTFDLAVAYRREPACELVPRFVEAIKDAIARRSHTPAKSHGRRA